MLLSGMYYGDQFKWFVGVVKSVIDEARVKVRIFGIHHTDDTTNVSDDDLPPALVLLPTTGDVRNHNLHPGTWVFGFFADGEDCQQPVIVGVAGQGSGITNNSSGPAGSGAVIPGQPGWDNSVIDISGNTNIEKSYNFLREKFEAMGRNDQSVHNTVCGILGRMKRESGLDPTVLNSAGGNLGAYGICQWRGDRQIGLKRRYGSNPSLAQQLSYFWDELHTAYYSKPRSMILSATTVYQACEGMSLFEVGEDVDTIRGINYVNTSHPVFVDSVRYGTEFANSIKYNPRQIDNPTPPVRIPGGTNA